jgi:hypothetical protein
VLLTVVSEEQSGDQSAFLYTLQKLQDPSLRSG